MEIRALWSDMKFYLFYMNSSMKNFEKKKKFLQFFQNRIQNKLKNK